VAIALPIFVALSRLYRGMHHPTDVIGSVMGALGCLAFAFLATRTGVAVAEANERAASEGSRPHAPEGERPGAPALSNRPADVEVSP
jgi:undecaprenyl-diphosphatase